MRQNRQHLRPGAARPIPGGAEADQGYQQLLHMLDVGVRGGPIGRHATDDRLRRDLPPGGSR
jgi:hypothetical protein